MKYTEQFETYTKKVCEQIRWKKARPIVAQEILDHLEDQKEAYLSSGDSESLAEEKALHMMGDPIAIGLELDNTHRPKPQWLLLILTGVLLLMGVFSRFYLGSLIGNSPYALSPTSKEMVLLLTFFAFVLCIGGYFLDFSFFGKCPLVLPSLLLFFLCILCLFGSTELTGIQKWISIGIFSIDPISVSLFAPLSYCGLLYYFRKYNEMGLLASIGIAAIFCVLFLYIGSMPACALFFFAGSILTISTVHWGWFGERRKFLFCFITIIALIAIPTFIFLSRYQLLYLSRRFITTFHPKTDLQNAGFQPYFLQEMWRNAGLFGAKAPIRFPDEIGSHVSDRLLTFYQTRSDYTLASMSYQKGKLFFFLFLSLFLGFLVFGFYKAIKQKSTFGKSVAFAILITFGFAGFFSILANLGFPLMASMPLPFLQESRSASLCYMTLAGILLSVFRTGSVFRDSSIPSQNKAPFVQ